MKRIGLIGILLCSFALVAQTSKPAKPAQDFRIAGTAYDASSGQTLPGARISLGSTEGNKVPDRSVLTGPDGAFAFDHLFADKYQMYGEAVGFPQQGFEQHEAPYLTGIVVGAGIDSEHLVFRLQRGSVISGAVSDEFNDPVRQANVMLFRRGIDNGRFSTHFAREAQTDDQGHYKFAPLLPGTYFVAVSARPWYTHSALELTTQTESRASQQVIENMKRLDVAFPLTYYSGVSDSSDATPIAVRSGDRVTADLALHSVPSAAVTIKTSPPQNGRMPFIRLSQQVFGDYDLPSQFEQRNRGEDMLFTGIAPGSYLAHITIPGGDHDRVQEIEVSGDTVLDPETMGASGSASIKGIVRMASGSPASREAVILIRNHKTGRNEGRRVDEQGTFEFDNLLPGTYEVSIANNGNVYLLDMAASNAKINGRAVTIAGTSSVDLAITLGKGMGEIHGVAQRDGKGLGGTMVVLVPVNADYNSVLFRRDQSDSDGTFTLPRVVPGKYSVVAIEGGWDLEWSRSEVLKPYLAKAETVEVAANGKYDIKVQVQSK